MSSEDKTPIHYFDCVLAPHELEEDLTEAAGFSLRRMEGSIIRGQGYLKEVKEVVSVEDGSVILNGSVRCRVGFRGILILPERGKPYTGNIYMISEHGIYVVDHKIRIFIPKANLSSTASYNQAAGSFTTGGKTYTKGDEITCTVVDVSYKSDFINSVGTLITKTIVLKSR